MVDDGWIWDKKQSNFYRMESGGKRWCLDGYQINLAATLDRN